jgi:hypothetical protein
MGESSDLEIQSALNGRVRGAEAGGHRPVLLVCTFTVGDAITAL